MASLPFNIRFSGRFAAYKSLCLRYGQYPAKCGYARISKLANTWLTQTLFRSPNTANDSGMTGSTGRRSRVRTGPRTYLPIMPSGFPMPAAVCAYRSGHRTRPRLPTWPLPLFRSTTLCLAPSLPRVPRRLCFSRLGHGE